MSQMAADPPKKQQTKSWLFTCLARCWGIPEPHGTPCSTFNRSPQWERGLGTQKSNMLFSVWGTGNEACKRQTLELPKTSPKIAPGTLSAHLFHTFQVWRGPRRSQSAHFGVPRRTQSAHFDFPARFRELHRLPVTGQGYIEPNYPPRVRCWETRLVSEVALRRCLAPG